MGEERGRSFLPATILLEARRDGLGAAGILGKGESHRKMRDGKKKPQTLRCAEQRGAPRRGCARGPAGLGGPGTAPPEAALPKSHFNPPKPGTLAAWLAFSCLVLFWKRKRLNPLQEAVSKSLFLKAIDCKSLI